jgi:hypothetical protein
MFGTAIHESLDAYYRSGRMLGDARGAFEQEWKRIDEELAREYGGLYQYVADEWLQHRTMGRLLLDQYHQFDQEDDFFRNVVEVAIEERSFIEILEPVQRVGVSGNPLLSGKIDLVVQQPNGLWVVDHKSLSKLASESALEVDDQLTAYCYIYWRITGEVPRGAMYNVLVKQPAVPPVVLKSGKLSVDKRQRTTWRMFMETAQQHDPTGLREGRYTEYIDMLKRRDWKPFFQRIGTQRTLAELKSFERRLYAEEDRYPNPSNRLCRTCPVLSLCHAMEAGDDVTYLRDNSFITVPARVTIPEGV